MTDVLDHPEADRLDWLKERATLQRRIKHQRKELRRLNALYRGMDLLVRNAFNRETTCKTNAYRHAAQIAEKHWFGYVAASYIRRWC